MVRCGCRVHVRSQVMLCREVMGLFFGPSANSRYLTKTCVRQSPKGKVGVKGVK